MKKLILIITMLWACSLAIAQDNTDKTLYIIDGVVSTKEAADELQSDLIRNMNVVKGVESVVVITTKAGRVITGRVVDTDGKPMIGVIVSVPNTKLGVVTGIDGTFNINLPAGEPFLVFSTIDYPTKTVHVDKADLGDVVMDKTQQGIVIINAYGKKTSDADPLCIVKTADGKLSKGDMPSISPDTIKSIHVFKDNQTEEYKKYGDTSNGVILIELK